MRSDPVPENVISITDPKDSVVDSNSGRENRASGMNTSESQTRMMGIPDKQSIGLPRLFSNLFGQHTVMCEELVG
jgi:hypothetical protein